MSKLSLKLDDLAIQSFSTLPAEGGRGTVHGLTGDQDTCVALNTCISACTRLDSCATCPASCFGTCASCPLSCNPADCPSSDGRC